MIAATPKTFCELCGRELALAPDHLNRLAHDGLKPRCWGILGCANPSYKPKEQTK